MQTKNKLKKTPIGEIPKEWEVVKLKDVVDIQQGEYVGSRNLKNEGYPVYGANGIIGYFTRFHYIDPQVVIACRGSTSGIVNMTKEKAFISNNAMALLPKNDKILKDFLYYIMSYEYITGKIKRIISGMGIPQIIKRDLEKYKIPLPPLPEQKKIAEILRTVDEAIEKTDLAIEKTERLKKGLMQRLLTKGIKYERFKKTELGEIPEEWRVVRLGELVKIQSGKYFAYSEFQEDGVRCLKIDNVGFGKVSWEITTYLPENYLERYPELVLKERDIVLALNRPIINGKLKIAMLRSTDEPAILYQRVGKLVIKSEYYIDRQFLFYLLMGDYFRVKLSRLLVGSDQPYIRTPVLLNIKIPLPPLDEQKQIAEILMTVDRKLELLRRRREKLERVKRGLMRDLLTGRRRVKVE